jgi:hypothetical protein
MNSVSRMLMMNIYNAETIQQQTSYRMTVDIMAATLKLVIRGEGNERDIENGAHLSVSQIQQYYCCYWTLIC